ncbi:hypothetical protein HPP92_012838 [Vanilla planifolia]|uniref:Uncharacterized protein n=1 Tax=Vanilla planifolia TaxID=51239 RepID=A0A835UW71_VANPL|nr:hypothetical protein HPP92_012838 [Vanilla planifolia]
METEQEREWFAAQKIVFSEDLVAAAKQQLEFLAAVDQRRYLYDGPLLERAVHRYKTCWLPLLARYTESGDPEGFLVVPLDCEWIWHCHRLNPVQYIKDCEEFYGRILDTKYVQSSVQAKLKLEAAETWSKLYPEEPFELDQMSALAESSSGEYKGATNSITYDLLSAVKRQSSFYYQVCRPFMHDKHFLDESVGRYKGFIHLIQRNWERSTRCFCVPTYDIDLMWHSHQLHPLSYQKHMLELLGKVLKHDDTDSDRSKGKRLDNGFSETTKQWEETYGLRYWRAGAMYRGSAPTSLEDLPPAPGHNHTKMLRFHKPRYLFLFKELWLWRQDPKLPFNLYIFFFCSI